MLVALLGVAGCSGAPADTGTTGGTKSELERRLAEVPSDAERRLVMLDFLEREVKEADARTVAARSKLHESLAREAAVSQQVSEHKNQLDRLERELSGLQGRKAKVERELIEAQALETRRDAAKKKTAELETELRELTTGMPALEAKVEAGRAANAAKILELERQIARFAESSRIAEEALARAREMSTGTPQQPASRPDAGKPDGQK